jgi:hypothetical protein
MKAKEKIKPKQIKPEKLTDFTDDWPLNELRDAIRKGEKSPPSNITSAEEHRGFFDRSVK